MACGVGGAPGNEDSVHVQPERRGSRSWGHCRVVRSSPVPKQGGLRTGTLESLVASSPPGLPAAPHSRSANMYSCVAPPVKTRHHRLGASSPLPCSQWPHPLTATLPSPLLWPAPSRAPFPVLLPGLLKTLHTGSGGDCPSWLCPCPDSPVHMT